MAGGGVYFAVSVADTGRKAKAFGVIIRCQVKLGRIKDVDRNGAPGVTFTALNAEGYDSVMIPRDNGREHVVYNHDQVVIDSYSQDKGATWTAYLLRKCRVVGCNDCGTGF